MDNWEDFDSAFQAIPFSSLPTDGDPLLVKLLYRPDKSSLAIMAVRGLSEVLFEGVIPRKVTRRMTDAMGERAKGVTLGVGEGEALLASAVEELLNAVADGTATAQVEEAGFETLINIAVPSFSAPFSFVADSLGQQSASVLASNLLKPLLGVTASLLGLLKESSTDEQSLHALVEEAVDTSGRVEQKDEGRTAERFMRFGGAGLVTRWIGGSQGIKAQDLQPVTLTLPSRSTSVFSPSRSQSAVPSPAKRRRSSPPPTARQPIHSSPSTSSRPFPSIAQQMLDYGGGNGERVGWDDSQSGAASFQPHRISSLPEKGKGRPLDQDVSVDVSIDEEPPTEDEDEYTSHQPSPRRFLRPSPSPTPTPFQPSQTASSGLSPAPPPADPHGSSYLRSPSAAPFASSQLAGDGDEDKKTAKDEKKKKKAEQEAAEELARRKARLARLAGGGGGKKKPGKKL